MNGIACKLECECPQKQRVERSRRYFVAPEIVYRHELGEYHTYGIRFCCSGRVKILHDISVDPKVVAQIVDKITRLDVSPIHLLEIVENLMP